MFINPLSNEKCGMGQRMGNFFKIFKKPKIQREMAVLEGLQKWPQSLLFMTNGACEMFIIRLSSL